MRYKQTVTSSNVDSVGFDSNTLFMRFKNGSSYMYKGVSYSAYISLVESDSVGKAFNSVIKGQYEFQKLDYDPFTKQEVAA